MNAPSVEQALSLLWHAARVSPYLREAVEVVEAEMRRLDALVRSGAALSLGGEWPST